MAVFLWLSLLFTVPAFAVCGDAPSLHKKINQLKVEAACSSVSLHDCLPLIRSNSADAIHRDDLSQGERCELDLYPLSRPTVKLATVIAEARLIPQARDHVNSLEEFFEHTRLHRERVKLLGMELFRTHPELFRGLTTTQVRIALEAHDRAKIMSNARGPGGKPFYSELYDYYGKKAPAPLVNSLNQADRKYMEDALKHAGLNDDVRMTTGERARRSALRAQLKQIEKVADLVDRGKSAVSPEEFGRPMRLASSYLANPQEARLAQELERNYSRLAVNLEYRPLTFSQAGRISREILRHETFTAAIRRSGFRAISLRAMAYHAIRRSKSGLAGIFQKLASPMGKRLLMASDFIGLYFAEMDQLGCDGIGYHDWVKDPNCRPAIGLTPKVLQFLEEDFPTQLDYLNNQPTTCQVLKETYNLSVHQPVVKSCNPQQLALELGDGNLVRVNLDGRKRIKSLDLGGLGQEAREPLRGVPDRVEIGANGSVSKACYFIGGRNPVRSCFDRPAELTAMNEFMKSINFQIQKAINGCLH
jgi:hypothetical protein